MHCATLTPEELRQLIEAAFAESRYPGDDRLVYDSSGDHLECNEIAAAFRGRHWQELPLDVLRYHHAALSFFTPEAYRYYLPAYLIASALHYEEADVVPDSVVFSLIPHDEGGMADYERRMEQLTPQQRQAICCFLEFMKAHHGADDVLGDLDKALAIFCNPQK